MKIIETILDSGSFVAINSLLKNSNVVGGYGTVENRLVYIYEQEGPVTAAHAKKIYAIYESALKVGAPVVGIFNSKGMLLDEGAICFDAYGQIMQSIALAKGKVPIISLVTGNCIGTMAILASMADFVIKTENANFFLQSANVLDAGQQSEYPYSHIVCKNNEECRQQVKTLLKLLPSNYLDLYTTTLQDDLNRSVTINAEDVQSLLKEIADCGLFIELQPEYTGISTALISCGGHPTGVLTAHDRLGSSAFEKASAFVQICASFHIPIVTFTNASTFDNSKDESEKLQVYAAKWIKTLADAQIPKINIILENVAGAPYLMLNIKSLGADIVFAWQDAYIGIIEKEASQKVLHQDTGISAIQAGELGLIDDIIEPFETRKRIIAALEMLYGKRGR